MKRPAVVLTLMLAALPGLSVAGGSNYTITPGSNPAFAAKVREITGGKGVPVVYDSVGRATFEGSLQALAPRGVLASFGESSGDPEPVSVRRLGHLGSVFVTHPSLIDYTATRAELLETAHDLFDMVSSGKIKIEINHSYPLREAAQAHRDVEARKTTGSVVMVP